MKDIIRELRKKRGLTQAELAARLNIAQSTVAMWENGSNIPKTEILLPLSKELKCKVDDLLKNK